MADTTEASSRGAVVGGRPLLVRGAFAVVVSALANAILLAAVLGTDAVPQTVHLTYPRVLLFTVLGTAAGVGLFAVLRGRVARPARTFRRVAVAALVLSLVPDVGLIAVDASVTVDVAVVLMAMHAVAAAVTVEALVGIRSG